MSPGNFENPDFSMVVSGKAVYIPGVLTSEGSIGANTGKYTAAAVIAVDMAVVT